MGDTAADRVRAIVARVAQLDAAEIPLDASFYDDLLLDSLQKLEIVVQIERVSGVRFSDHEAAGIRRVRDAVALLRAKGALARVAHG